MQDTPQDEVSWEATKVVAQDGILAQLGKKLISSEGVFVEIGARRLFSALSRFIWNGKPHLSLSDVWEYCNRFTYLPRLRDKEVLRGAVVKAVSEMIPGPFAFADDVDEDGQYDGLLIDKGRADLVLIDSRSVIVKAEVAAKQRQEDDIFHATPTGPQLAAAPTGPPVRFRAVVHAVRSWRGGASAGCAPPLRLRRLFRIRCPGPSMGWWNCLRTDRPGDMTKILEGIIEQITSVTGGDRHPAARD